MLTFTIVQTSQENTYMLNLNYVQYEGMMRSQTKLAGIIEIPYESISRVSTAPEFKLKEKPRTLHFALVTNIKSVNLAIIC